MINTSKWEVTDVNRIETIATFGLLEKLLEKGLSEDALDVVRRILRAAEGKENEPEPKKDDPMG